MAGAIWHYRGKNAASEAPIEGHFFHVQKRRDGRPWRGKEYVDEAEARAAFQREELAESDDNVEIVKRLSAAYAEGGFEATRSFCDPDVEMVRIAGSVQPTARGFDAMVETMRDWQSMFEDFHAEPVEFIDAGEHVVVALEEHGTPRGGGVELRQTYYMLYTLRDGVVASIKWFGDRQDSLETAGLSE
jgi:ketosteroid isomerase-like protein